MRYEQLMVQNLFNLCSENARNAIIKQRSKAARAGYHMKYADLIEIALDAERIEKNPEATSKLYSFPTNIDPTGGKTKSNIASNYRMHRSRSPYDRQTRSLSRERFPQAGKTNVRFNDSINKDF